MLINDIKVIESDWLRGDWYAELPSQAWAFARHQPSVKSLSLALGIQHAILGLDHMHLQNLKDQVAELPQDISWSRLILRLLCAYLQLGLIDEAHEIVKAHLPGSCGLMRSRHLRLFPLALEFLDMHYCEKLGYSVSRSTSAAVSLLANRDEVDVRFFNKIRTGSPDCEQGSLRVAVVGNGPSLLHSSNGAVIDDHDIVVRFNTPVISDQIQQFTGQRTDLLVVSPALAKHAPAPGIKAMAVTGINILAGQTSYWQRLAQNSRSMPVGVFPETHWYGLVAQLKSPPSAGLLLLTSIADIEQLNVSGFGFTVAANDNIEMTRNNTSHAAEHASGAHYGDKQKPSTRHNWAGESQLLAEMDIGQRL